MLEVLTMNHFSFFI